MSEEILIVYTWHDIERTLLLDKANWPQEWQGIEVYSMELKKQGRAAKPI